MSIPAVLKSMGIDAAEFEYLIRCVVRLYLALQREVPSAAEVFEKVQRLKTISTQESSVPSESSPLEVAQVQKKIGQMMVDSVGAGINASEIVLQALGEALLANNLERSKPGSTFYQRLYSSVSSNDVSTMRSHEADRVRDLCKVFEGKSLSNRAVAALLLSFDDMSSPFFRSILPSSARLLNAYDLAVELGSLTYLRGHYKAYSGWKNAFSGALATLSRRLALPALISESDLGIIQAICLEIYNLPPWRSAVDPFEGLLTNLGTVGGNQSDSLVSVMKVVTSKRAVGFESSIDHPNRTAVCDPPGEARTGKIGWEYVGQYSLGYYQEFRTLFDIAQ